MNTGYYQLSMGRKAYGAFTAESISEQDYICILYLFDLITEHFVELPGLFVQTEIKRLVIKGRGKMSLYLLPTVLQAITLTFICNYKDQKARIQESGARIQNIYSPEF